MTSADLLVERGAQRLHLLAGRAAARGDGIGTWLAEELEADAAFLRKLKPSLIAARMRTNGAAPAEPQPAPGNPEPPAPGNPEPPPAASAEPTAPSKRNPRPSGRPWAPWLLVGAALTAGILAARALDWRGHATRD